MIDDYGQTAGNQNEGTSSEDLGANIAPGIKDYGVYKEGVTLSVTTNNAAITSGEAEGKIIDNDDNINITETIDANSIIDPDLLADISTMKTIIDTKDGDDTLTLKIDAVISDTKGVEYTGDATIKMGDGDDVFNVENNSVIDSSKIDLGNAGGEKNQDTLNIDGALIMNTRITSHDGNDVFTIKDSVGSHLGSTNLDNVILKTGAGNDTVSFEKGANSVTQHLSNVKVDTGSGNDTVNIANNMFGYDSAIGATTTDGTEYAGSRTDSFVKTGEGDDTINVTGASISRVDIDTGDSDTGDMLNFISAGIYNSEIKSGNGNDQFKFENTNLDKTSVNSSEGNDTIKIGDEINMKNSSVTVGNGNDTVDLGKGISLDNSTITGGEGTDTLKIHDDSFNTTNAGKISGFEVLDMSEFDGVFRFFQASDISNFIKNVGGEGATSLIVKGVEGVGKFEEGSSEIASAGKEDSNGNHVYSVNDGGQTFTLTIENDITINPSM